MRTALKPTSRKKGQQARGIQIKGRCKRHFKGSLKSHYPSKREGNQEEEGMTRAILAGHPSRH